MRKLGSVVVAGVAAVALSFAVLGTAGTTSAQAASCVKKAGMGTGGDEAAASFQAWEAVLQATDWGMWSVWISGGGKVGTAPGYKVSALKKRCKAGGMGRECVIQATLCK
jgi:hypothetical protein